MTGYQAARSVDHSPPGQTFGAFQNITDSPGGAGVAGFVGDFAVRHDITRLKPG